MGTKIMTSTGITTNLVKGAKSYSKNNEQTVTRIEVDSEIYNEDTIYQDVTIDTAYKNWQKNELKNLFKNIQL